MKKIAILLIFTLLLSSVAFATDGVIRNKPNGQKLIALTFDDGPHEKFTNEILNILDEYGVKATFFIIGENAEKHPEIVKKIHDLGHEIGNHTYSHIFINKVSKNSLKSEIMKTEEILEKITGQKPKLFRPPGGAYNNSCVSTLNELGYSCILWSFDSRDWTLPDASKVISEATYKTKEGDILLFHDFNQKGSPTPTIIKTIIPLLINSGFKFVTVSELINFIE